MREDEVMRRKTVPVSTLARLAVDPAGFSIPPSPSMLKVAAHGICWHEQPGSSRPSATVERMLALTALLVILAVAVWLFLSL